MSITSCSSQTFASFFNDWLLRHKQLVQHLARVSSPDENTIITPADQKSFVTHFLSHWLQYYHDKSAAASVAGDDVFDFFSPPWLSSYEKLLFWVGGFKPGIVFKLITGSVNDVTRQQQDQLVNIRSETKRKERNLMRDFALLQQSMADPPLMVLTKRLGALGLSDGEQSEMEEAMKVMKSDMREAMNNADQLRCWTVEKVVEVLNPQQAIKLFRAVGEFYLRLNDMGVQIDHQSA